jgi:ATP phosphoribosyltransferase
MPTENTAAVAAARTANPTEGRTNLRLALPKGRMADAVFRLLADAGIRVGHDPRAYRPTLSLPGVTAKLLKPQNIVGMLAEGSRDVGFAGADWVAETGADLVELLDTGLDPVRIVVAAPPERLCAGRLQAPAGRGLVVASEYERLTREWLRTNAPTAHFLRAYGATEVFPPEDADAIVDNTASGATLRANGLEIVAEVLRSSTRLYASREALRDDAKRRAIDDLVLCLGAVLEARRRVMLELNVAANELERVVAELPCMRAPTIAPLHAVPGFAVRAAVPRDDLPRLLPRLKSAGATDLVVSNCEQIVP